MKPTIEYSARGTSSQEGLEHLDRFERKLERRNSVQRRRLGESRHPLDRNESESDIQLMDEIGVFDDKPEGWEQLPRAKDFVFAGEEWDEQKMHTLLIQARKDAMSTRLHCRTIYDSINSTNNRIQTLLFIVIAILIYIAIRLTI